MAVIVGVSAKIVAERGGCECADDTVDVHTAGGGRDVNVAALGGALLSCFHPVKHQITPPTHVVW